MGIEFEEVLADDPKVASYIEEKTGMRKVPVVENGKGLVVGFNPEKIKELASA